MGYDHDSFSLRLTSPYARDLKGVDWPRPDGFPEVSSEPMGSSGSDGDLVLRGGNITLTLDPTTSSFSLDRGPLGVTGTIPGFTEWAVIEVHPQFAVVDLGGGSTVEMYSIGIVRFHDTDVVLDEAGDMGDSDRWPFHVEFLDDWWVASESPVSISSGDVQYDESFALFFHRSDAPDYWASIAVAPTVQDRLIPSTNNSRLYQAIRAATWLRHERTLKEIERDAYPLTAIRGALDRHGKMVDTPRARDQDDEDYRIDILTETKIRYGGDSESDIISFIEAILRAPEGSVAIVNRNKNPETGLFEPARFQVTFPFELLSEIGFTAEEYPEVIEKIDALLLRATASGVFADVVPEGGAIWDEDDWDGDGAVYGS